METNSINKADHFAGNLNAKIRLSVYEDYECECCANAFRYLTAVHNFFKDKICILYKNFPLVNMHPSALKAAFVAEACSIQHKFLQARDLIFEYQEYLEYGLGAILQLLRRKHSISLEQLKQDVQKEVLKEKIRDDIESGNRLGVKNTPAIFINGREYVGLAEADGMIELIEKLLLSKSLQEKDIYSNFATVAVWQ